MKTTSRTQSSSMVTAIFFALTLTVSHAHADDLNGNMNAIAAIFHEGVNAGIEKDDCSVVFQNHVKDATPNVDVTIIKKSSGQTLAEFTLIQQNVSGVSTYSFAQFGANVSIRMSANGDRHAFMFSAKDRVVTVKHNKKKVSCTLI